MNIAVLLKRISKNVWNLRDPSLSNIGRTNLITKYSNMWRDPDFILISRFDLTEQKYGL